MLIILLILMTLMILLMLMTRMILFMLMILMMLMMKPCNIKKDVLPLLNGFTFGLSREFSSADSSGLSFYKGYDSSTVARPDHDNDDDFYLTFN